MRSTLVRGESLTAIARQLELGQYLLLGPGELKSGGHRRDSILEDAVEAVIGAVYLDGGMGHAKRLILSWYQQALDDIRPGQHQKDAKTRLQEWLQGRRQPLPEYTVVDISGKDHEQVFRVRCRVNALNQEIEACGSSRRRAEQKAAEQMLERLNEK